jgi:hypothetical protein
MIAIDALLEPDPVLLARARAANARLRVDLPAGFAFDDTHLPHVTLAQRYLRQDDLPAACEAVARVAADHDPRGLRLQVHACHVRIEGDTGTASWLLAPDAALDRLARECLDALAPFAVSGGTAAAFVPNDDGSPIRDSTVRYVETFVPEHSGERYVPHVTLGRARAAFLRRLAGEAFTPFPFVPASLAVYQLGNHGTARRRLWRQPGR